MAGVTLVGFLIAFQAEQDITRSRHRGGRAYGRSILSICVSWSLDTTAFKNWSFALTYQGAAADLGSGFHDLRCNRRRGAGAARDAGEPQYSAALLRLDGLLPANLRRHPESALATVAVSAMAWIVASPFHSFVLRRGKRTPFGYGSRTSANRFP